MAAGADPETLAPLLGLVLAWGTLIVTFLLARRLLPTQPLLWAMPAWLLAASSSFVVEAVQGLETVFLAFLLAAGVLLWSLEFDDAAESKRRPWSGLVMALAALTRPEGALLFVAVLVILALWPANHGRPRARRLAPWLALFALPMATHLVLRLAYYGDWLPNTFRAKTGGGLAQAARGLDYVGAGALHIAGWLALAVLLLLPTPVRAPRRRTLLLVTALWVMAWAGVAAEGGDFKPTFRFLAWSLPLPALLAAAGLGRWLRPGLPAPIWRRAAAAVVLVMTLSWTFTGSAAARLFARQRPADLELLRQASHWFAANLPPDAILATGPAGAIPYYTKLITVDMWGLNDRDIARRVMPDMGQGAAGHEKGDGAAVLRRRPDVILFTNARFSREPVAAAAVSDIFLYISERELLEQAEFRELYRWRSVRLPATYLNFYQRTTDVEPTP